MEKIKKVDNFEIIIKFTIVIIFFVHLIYTFAFFITEIYFLIPPSIIQIILALILGYFVLFKNRCYTLTMLFAHFDILFSCCYSTYHLGWGYGFSMIIVLLLSLAYIQNFNNLFVPLAICIFETLMFFIMLWITKDKPNYPNPYMHYINIANFFFMVITVLIYIWLSDKENERILKRLDDKKEFLKYKSEYDYLTSLLNRRAMNDVLDENIKKLNDKKNSSLIFAIADLDNFKILNDTYGHHFGDIVLKNVSQSLINQYKNLKNVFISRWGGEEFVILFVNYDYNYAIELLEESRAIIEKLNNSDNLNESNITVSIGISYAQSETLKDLLITKADSALYNAKYLGKNRVKVVKLG
ncbi:GGDEF domain-containing protein [Campylobacter sp. MG1]|uniref:GGDEF domain-containing protein n=1 Tax=Campylobacter sp. MG1 TaxID=2976332 RepID=UPI00226D0F2E|nr:GGDEF domain-containing protein [Campylobacter sp. MG1]